MAVIWLCTMHSLFFECDLLRKYLMCSEQSLKNRVNSFTIFNAISSQYLLQMKLAGFEDLWALDDWWEYIVGNNNKKWVKIITKHIAGILNIVYFRLFSWDSIQLPYNMGLPWCFQTFLVKNAFKQKYSSEIFLF